MPLTAHLRHWWPRAAGRPSSSTPPTTGPVRVLVYADFRSPHARGWADGLAESGLDVIRVSSEVSGIDGVMDPSDRLSTWRQRAVEGKSAGSRRLPAGREGLHALVALARLPARWVQLRRIIRNETPHVVHALRVPYEGVTALTAVRSVPVVVSTWGSDFVPQAQTSRVLAAWARRALSRCAGLHHDSPTDLPRAIAYGLSPQTPTLLAAGNFGVDHALFFAEPRERGGHVVYPRGPQAFSNPLLFLETAAVLAANRELRFTAVGLEGYTDAESFVASRGLGGRVRLTPRLERGAFAEMLRSADVVVSPAATDGTPNSLLEAMACGAEVVAGDIAPLRELQRLVPTLRLTELDAATLAGAVRAALSEERSGVTIPAPFDRARNRSEVPAFYERVLATSAQARAQ